MSVKKSSELQTSTQKKTNLVNNLFNSCLAKVLFPTLLGPSTRQTILSAPAFKSSSSVSISVSFLEVLVVIVEVRFKLSNANSQEFNVRAEVNDGVGCNIYSSKFRLSVPSS